MTKPIISDEEAKIHADRIKMACVSLAGAIHAARRDGLKVIPSLRETETGIFSFSQPGPDVITETVIQCEVLKEILT